MTLSEKQLQEARSIIAKENINKRWAKVKAKKLAKLLSPTKKKRGLKKNTSKGKI